MIVRFFQGFFYKLGTFFYLWNELGIRIVIGRYAKAIAGSIFRVSEQNNAESNQSCVVSMVTKADLELLTGDSLPESSSVPSSTWVWATPPFGKGSGGHHDIFMLAKRAEDIGVKSIIGLTDAGKIVDANSAVKSASEFYDFHNGDFRNLANLQTVEIDLAIATGWQTFAPAMRIKSNRRAYLVQDFEPWFFPTGTHSYLAERTYEFGIPCLTAGPWLASRLRDNYGSDTEYFDLGYSPEIYSLGEYTLERNKIVIYYRAGTPRRSSDLMLEIVRVAAKKLADFEIHFVGGRPSSVPQGNVIVHGSLNHEELADLYRTAAVTAVFSMTNTSLVPVEALAAGSSVLTNLSVANEINLAGTATTFEKLDFHRMVAALVSIAKNSTADLALANSESVKGREWELQSKKAVDFLMGIECG